MNSTQRTIKYCAMAFSILLAVGIISGMATILFSVINVINGNSKEFNFITHKNKTNKSMDYDKEFTNVKSLKIDNSIGSLEIRIGDEFRVVAYNVTKKFIAEIDESGRLSVMDRGDNFKFLWFDFDGVTHPNSKIVVYVPSDFAAKEVLISTGAGNTSIEGINTDYLYIDGGAGSISGTDIVAKKVKLNSGVGSTTFNNVTFGESTFDCGVGKFEVSGKLFGETNVDCGVGEVKLDVAGEEGDYGYNVDTGVGPIKWNGHKISGKNNAQAENLIKVDGGVGPVYINIQ